MLVVAGAAATITRYVALRTWVFARARAAAHGGRGGVVLRPRMAGALDGKVALVAGATRGAGRGIAVGLGEEGATVYATGRSTRGRRSEVDRPETIEETAELVTAAGGTGIAVVVDHLVSDEVRRWWRGSRPSRAASTCSSTTSGARSTSSSGTRRCGSTTSSTGCGWCAWRIETHLITSHHALPLLIARPGGLLIEVTDGTAEYNAERYRDSLFYDLAKNAVIRLAWAQAQELAPHGATAVALTPGWLRSEAMLEAFGVTEETWREAVARVPHFCSSESPAFVGRAAAALAADPDVARWSGQSLSSGALAQVYGFTDVDGTRPDAWRYIVEVTEAGLPADDTGYR